MVFLYLHSPPHKKKAMSSIPSNYESGSKKLMLKVVRIFEDKSHA